MVIILLATYNGDRFLHEQLASFENQTYTDWKIIWRDDGSTDNTISIMKKFCLKTKRCVQILNSDARLGPALSFMLLLQEAEKVINQEDTIMFSDQDDVWLPEKIAKAKKSLACESFTLPLLYFARQKIVDTNLLFIRESTKINFLPPFPDCLTHNVATGCTMALNYFAVKLINKTFLPKNCYHDWWAYIIVSACGGKCIYDDSTVILYRQHSSNTVGVQSSYLRRSFKALLRGPSSFMNVFRESIHALSRSNLILNDGSRKIVFLLQESLCKKRKLLYAAAKIHMKRQNKLETLLFYIWMMFG